MKSRRLAVTGWSRDAKVPESTLRSFLNGKSSAPRQDTLEKLAAAVGVSVSEMIGETRGQLPKFVAIKALSVRAELSGRFELNDTPSSQDLHWRGEWVEHYLGGNAENGRYLTIEGETLVEGLHQNDVVCVDLSRLNPGRDPGIYCVFDGRDILIRRLQALSGRGETLRMLSDNSLYPSYEVDAREVQVIGRVVWRAGAV